MLFSPRTSELFQETPHAARKISQLVIASKHAWLFYRASSPLCRRISMLCKSQCIVEPPGPSIHKVKHTPNAMASPLAPFSQHTSLLKCPSVLQCTRQSPVVPKQLQHLVDAQLSRVLQLHEPLYRRSDLRHLARGQLRCQVGEGL